MPLSCWRGVIAYETNLLTGGVGAKYFGLGGSTEFRRDTVTSMLRAVSVKNGSVLNQVDARKTIFSISLDSGLYRFVSFMRLLEAEASITSNEPPQMAVMESIEACVYAMIMEGLVNNLWGYKDQSRVKSLIEGYLKQRDSKMVAELDDKGRVVNLKPADMETN
ncbi:CsgG/HfaB family protein [Methylobacter svalbardensis]|uniref:CsgG/HfaB family protein n=1 Tax=Methylobacter svalbardensis TaxID=3080016 RepID=UPI0030EDEABC